MTATADLLHAVHEIREAAPEYARAEEFYRGEVPELFCSEPVRRALRGSTIGFDLNLARRPVDAVLDRLSITAVQVPGDEDATRRLIDRVWTPNRMSRYSKQINWAACTFGDAYLIVWPGEVEGTVELHYNAPTTTRVFYDPENPRVKSYAAKLWAIGHRDQRLYRCNLYYADRIERWTTGPGARGDQSSEWAPFVVDEGDEWPIPNPFNAVPVFHFRIGDPYGRPLHVGAYGPQHAITKLSATLMSTVDFAAFPQRYALLTAGAPGSDGAAQVEWDDEINTGEDEEPALRSGPGTVWNLPGVDSVGQFDPANMNAFLDPLRFYARGMAAATATPLRFFEPSGDVPSGAALRADDAPLAHRIHDVQEWLGEEYANAFEFAGQVIGEPFGQPDIKWRPVHTVDDVDGWNAVLLKMQAGVPPLQALTEAGYDSALVEGWLASAPPAPSAQPAPDAA